MNQTQPSSEFLWDASLRQALSALRDCLEEARRHNQPIDLLDRDVLLDDLRACYRIISAWPTAALPEAPAFEHNSPAEPAAPLSLPHPDVETGDSPEDITSTADEDLTGVDDAPEGDSSAADEDLLVPAETPDVDPTLEENDSSANALSSDSSNEDPLSEPAQPQIEWIVGDPPTGENETDADQPVHQPEDDERDEPGIIQKEEDSNEGVLFGKRPEDECTADEAKGHRLSTGEVHTGDSSEGDIYSEEIWVEEATVDEIRVDSVPVDALPMDEIPDDETLADAISENELTSEETPAKAGGEDLNFAPAAEGTQSNQTSFERTRRTELYAPSLFELSNEPPYGHPQQEPASPPTEAATGLSVDPPPGESNAGVEASRIERLIHSGKGGAARLADARRIPISDIKKGLGLNEKFLLMRSFFSNDAMRFTADLDRLNRTASLIEAEKLLFETLLPGRNWDADSEADLTLLLIVYRRFCSR